MFLNNHNIYSVFYFISSWDMSDESEIETNVVNKRLVPDSIPKHDL